MIFSPVILVEKSFWKFIEQKNEFIKEKFFFFHDYFFKMSEERHFRFDS